MPKIIIEDETNQVYQSVHGTPTIHLGDGSTMITSLITPDGLGGIGFIDLGHPTEVGVRMPSDDEGKRADEVGVYFQIMTRNTASIDVLIDQLQQAKEEMLALTTDIS
jgi:hypothetical protein